MKKILAIAVIIVAQTMLLAQSDDAYKKFLEQEQKAASGYIQKDLEEFKNFKIREELDFKKFKDQIEKEWNEFLEPSKKIWVSYSNDFRGRGQVDYEQGKVKVEAVVEKTDPKADEKAKIIVKKQLEAIVKTKDNKGKSVVDAQVAVPEVAKNVTMKDVITEKNIDKIAEKIVKSAPKKVVKGNDGKPRVKYIIDLNMVPNHLQVRVKKYKPAIDKQCKRFNVPVALALGIMHTESYFNPKAYNSRGNAYGLMQVVPTSAGRTMNKKLYNKNSDPSKKQLLTADFNIEFGVGYLRHLIDYFKNKKVDGKKANVTGANNLWCVIPAYNGGQGQVFYGMTGKMNRIGKAWEPMWRNLRDWNSEKLYNKLRKDMAAEETRDYLKKVRDKMENLYGWK